MNSIYKTNEFAIEVISRGSFLDDDPGFGGNVYAVETATVRLNHIALNQWLLSQTYNPQECYETEKEWEAHRRESDKRREDCERKIIAALGWGPTRKGITITQVISEVFAAVYIHKAQR